MGFLLDYYLWIKALHIISVIFWMAGMAYLGDRTIGLDGVPSLFAENERTHYVAYVSEQNLVIDDSDTPLSHPDIQEWFNETGRGRYELKKGVAN